MDRKDNHLREILGIDSLYATQNAFAQMTRTAVVLLDANGNMSTPPNTEHDFYGIFTSDKKLKKEWTERIRGVFSQEMTPGETIYLDAGMDGLSVALVPIHLGGEQALQVIRINMKICSRKAGTIPLC